VNSVQQRMIAIHAMRRAVPAVLSDFFQGKDVCILASRIGSELLREENGIDAKPVSARAWILNAQMWEYIEEDWERLVEKWPEEDEQAALDAGAWSVGLGMGRAEPGRFAGHVLLALRNPDGLLDLTLNQASRPTKGMTLEPTFMAAENRRELRTFLNGEGAFARWDEESGTRMVYVRVDEDFRRAPDWQSPTPGHRQLHAAVKERVRARYRREIRDLIVQLAE
jgi:hypothetical protein